MSYKSNLQKELKANLTLANKKLAEMERDGLGKLTVNKFALKKQSKITGRNPNIKSFAQGQARSIAKMEQLNNQLRAYINSPWTSPEGRKAIYAKGIKTAQGGGRANRGGGWSLRNDWSESEVLTAIDIFATDFYANAKNSGLLTSEQVIVLVDIASRVDGGLDSLSHIIETVLDNGGEDVFAEILSYF